MLLCFRTELLARFPRHLSNDQEPKGGSSVMRTGPVPLSNTAELHFGLVPQGFWASRSCCNTFSESLSQQKKRLPPAGVNLQLEEPLVMNNCSFCCAISIWKTRFHPAGGLLGSWAVGSCWMSFWVDVVLQGDLSFLSPPHWLGNRRRWLYQAWKRCDGSWAV